MSCLRNVACLQTVPRDIENQTFVNTQYAVSLVDGGGECYEHSLLVNSWGEILVDGGVSPGLVQSIIGLDQIRFFRSKIPSITNDRPDGLAQKS